MDERPVESRLSWPARIGPDTCAGGRECAAQASAARLTGRGPGVRKWSRTLVSVSALALPPLMHRSAAAGCPGCPAWPSRRDAGTQREHQLTCAAANVRAQEGSGSMSRRRLDDAMLQVMMHRRDEALQRRAIRGFEAP